MPQRATDIAKKGSNQTRVNGQEEISGKVESPEMHSYSGLPVTGMHKDSRLTRTDILALQRTVGNQAVMRLLSNNRSRSVGPISPAVIQRKVSLSASMNLSITQLASTADNTIFSSTFKDVKDYIISYLRAKDVGEEAKYLKKIQTAAQEWRKKNASPKGSRDRQKLTVLTELESIVSQELGRIEGDQNLTEVGLSGSFIKELSEVEYSNLITAVYLAKQGKMETADLYLEALRKTRGDAVTLIRSNIVRTHIGKIDPGLAKAMNKADFKVSAKKGSQGAKYIQGAADEMVNFYETDKKGFEDKYGEKMGTETAGLSNKGMMKGLGYTEAPLRNLATAGKTLQSGKALQTGKAPSEEAKASMKSLSGNEMTALVGYTSNLYGSFSNPLRKEAGKKTFTKDNLALTQTAVSAMNKFKSYTGFVYRHDSIYPGFKELNRPGGVTTDLGFMSTAKEQQAASNGGTHHQVLLVLTSKTGKEIAVASIFGGEGEVLFKPGTRFRVTKAETKDPVNGWQNADAEVQKFVNADGKADMLEMVVIKEEI